MDEKEIKRYRELSKKLELTDEEQTELDALEAKKIADEEAEKMAKAFTKAIKASGLLEVKGNIESKSNEEVGKDNVYALLEKNADYRISMQLVCQAAKKLNNEDRFKKTYGVSTVEMLDKLKAMDIKAAQPQTEGTGADGGILVPTITQARILELIPTFGQARTYMQSFPMSGNPQKLPKELTNPSAYWVDENNAITDSKLTLEELTLTPKKLASIVTASNEVLMDARPDLGAYIVKKIAQAFGIAEDVQFFAGTGSPFTGIFAGTNTFGSEINTATIDPASLTYRNFLSMIAGVDQNYVTNAGFFAHRSLMPYVWGLEDDQHRPIFMPAYGSMPATIFGYPIYWIENAPSYTTAAATPETPFLLFGDLTNSYIGDVMGMTVKVFEEGTVDGTSLIENDLTGIRVIKRVAFNKGLIAKYSVLSTHS